jgi:hypothetical protein
MRGDLSSGARTGGLAVEIQPEKIDVAPASENTSSALGHATSVRKVMARTPLEPKEVGPFDLAGLPGVESFSSSGAPGGRLRVHVLG